MPKLSDLRKKSDDELCVWISGWKEGSADHIAGLMELRRRQERPNQIRGWIAVGIAAFSMVVSMAALIAAINQ